VEAGDVKVGRFDKEKRSEAITAVAKPATRSTSLVLTPESSGEESIGLDRIVRAAALHRSRRAEREEDAESEGNAHCKHLRKKPFFSPDHYKIKKRERKIWRGTQEEKNVG
jgi:hypothetical protein